MSYNYAHPCACLAEYAQVTRMLGNGRLEAFCFDGVNRLCHIRGKLRKRVWIGVGDIILLGLREFQDQKADIILKYDGDEARSLKTYGELPDTVQINAGAETLEGEEFGDDSANGLHVTILDCRPFSSLMPCAASVCRFRLRRGCRWCRWG
jgi:initiation factor 1A